MKVKTICEKAQAKIKGPAANKECSLPIHKQEAALASPATSSAVSWMQPTKDRSGAAPGKQRESQLAEGRHQHNWPVRRAATVCHSNAQTPLCGITKVAFEKQARAKDLARARVISEPCCQKDCWEASRASLQEKNRL